ncbi:TRAP transporter substrate-binding protein [Pararhodobacter aggregans]|uniref:C4-dicarboxylate ABC transporter substrate-binding protein n=1 Tax=Pararhodobacter aggregans TaxID=404875 RepID=A0A2T7UTA0_9RHOB|nr:TRAP transporter substrate-binding protein [Pararhodobacter aggregans]PTX02715.1 TRAP-type C4-dicarboxylate transport system substrate-binding protein [Pararhodobacter aggregans]PVE47947.1 C4-dicarboxylate ABC transporter substrate-binding protein [Pararhodobacter aggregans]
MKKILLAASALALFASAASAQIKISLDSPPDLEGSGSYVWAHAFSTYLNEHGLAAEEYQRGALGGDDEVFDQVSQGLVEVGLSPLGIVASIDTLIYGLRLPYFFADMAAVDRALYDNGMLAAINEGLDGSGVQVLAVDTVGPATGIFNTLHPVTSMADMSDLRMRALDESQIQLYAAWGSTGTVVSWAEVPNALQTGVANGYLNPAFVPLLFGHTDFIKYFTPAEISPSLRIVIVSEDWYEGLSDSDRATVDAAAAAANEANRSWLGTQTGVIAQLEAAGVTISELSPEARAEFQTASATTYDLIVSPEQLAQWQAAIAE